MGGAVGRAGGDLQAARRSKRLALRLMRGNHAVALRRVEDACRVLARRHRRLDHDVALLGEAVEASKLDQRLRMVVDAEIEDRIGLAAPKLDRRGLPASLVA